MKSAQRGDSAKKQVIVTTCKVNNQEGRTYLLDFIFTYNLVISYLLD